MRLTRDQLNAILIFLVWYQQYQGPKRMRDVYEELWLWYRGLPISERTSKLGMALLGADLENRRPTFEINELIDLIVGSSSRGEGYEGDLLDLLSEELRLPMGVASLQGKSLKRICKAIQTTDDLKEVAEAIKQENTCRQCLRTIEDFEAIVLVREDDRRVPMCSACVNLEKAKCPLCGDTISFVERFNPKRIRNCDFHKKKEEKVEVHDPAQAAPPVRGFRADGPRPVDPRLRERMRALRDDAARRVIEVDREQLRAMMGEVANQVAFNRVDVEPPEPDLPPLFNDDEEAEDAD